MQRSFRLGFLALGLVVATGGATAETRDEKKARILAPSTNFETAERFEDMQGGSGTNRTRLDSNAFSQPSKALSFEQRSDFFVGNGIFDRPWVAAPSSTLSSDGLGPLFNARSCQGCHLKDGRGHPPNPGDVNIVSMLFGLSQPDGAPDPIYGHQLQDQSLPGFEPEGRLTFEYTEEEFVYPDGRIVALRTPHYSTDAPLADGVSLNPRIAPPMIGLGLVEAISDADIVANADPEDQDNDGISGRANILADGSVGRFGWKATSPTLEDQAAVAFSNDMGLSTWPRPDPWGDCTEAQVECREALHGDSETSAEIEDQLLDLLVFYTANLAVPKRRNVTDGLVLAGKEAFYSAGCTSCHTPKFATRSDAPKEQRNQLIWPYSDFLLHDLGPGLADKNPTGSVAGYEWRTAPLWGIGLTETVNGHTFFLHDGRARSLEEAILWHEGEALASRDAFAAMNAEKRDALITFLESL